MVEEIILALLWAAICWYGCRFVWWLMTRKRKNSDVGLSSAVSDLLDVYADINSEVVRRGIREAERDKEHELAAQNAKKEER
jgi:hypothetical protein